MKDYFKNRWVLMDINTINDETLSEVVSKITEQMTRTLTEGKYDYITIVFSNCAYELVDCIDQGLTTSDYPHTTIATLPTKDDSLTTYYIKVDLKSFVNVANNDSL